MAPDFGNPQALNRYAYTLNNPVKLIDPSGHAAEVGVGSVLGRKAWELLFRNYQQKAEEAGNDYAGHLSEYYAHQAVQSLELSRGNFVNAELSGIHAENSLMRAKINGLEGLDVALDTAVRQGGDLGESSFGWVNGGGAIAASSGFGLGRKLRVNEKVVVFESSQGSGTFKTWEAGERGGISAQSINVVGTPEQGYLDAFGRNPRPGEPYWETTGEQIATARRFAYHDEAGSPGHVGIYGGKWTPKKWFTSIWTKKEFP